MTNIDPQLVFARDVAERALNSAWQGAVVVAIPVIAASELSDYTHLAWWKQLGAVVGVAAGNAVLSMIKSLFAGMRTGTASLSSSVAQTAVVAGSHAADTVQVETIAPAAPSDDTAGAVLPPDADLNAIGAATAPAAA